METGESRWHIDQKNRRCLAKPKPAKYAGFLPTHGWLPWFLIHWCLSPMCHLTVPSKPPTCAILMCLGIWNDLSYQTRVCHLSIIIIMIILRRHEDTSQGWKLAHSSNCFSPFPWHLCSTWSVQTAWGLPRCNIAETVWKGYPRDRLHFDSSYTVVFPSPWQSPLSSPGMCHLSGSTRPSSPTCPPSCPLFFFLYTYIYIMCSMSFPCLALSSFLIPFLLESCPFSFITWHYQSPKPSE